MKLEYKYEQIKKSAILDARKKADIILSDMKKELEKENNDRIEQVKSSIQKSVVNASRIATLDRYKLIADETYKAKIEVLDEQRMYTDYIFDEVRNNLNSFMKTNEYKDMIKEWIKRDIEYKKDSDILTIYINKADKDYLDEFKSQATYENVEVVLSDTDFIGGIKSVITNKQILIDHSFESKLGYLKDHFVFEGIKNEQ